LHIPERHEFHIQARKSFRHNGWLPEYKTKLRSDDDQFIDAIINLTSILLYRDRSCVKRQAFKKNVLTFSLFSV